MKAAIAAQDEAISELKQKLFTKDSTISDLKTTYEERMAELQNLMASQAADKDKITAQLEEDVKVANEQIEYWKSAALRNPVSTFNGEAVTACGVITGTSNVTNCAGIEQEESIT